MALEEHLRACGEGKFPFFKIIEEKKSLKKSSDDHFIDKFKPLLNKTTSVSKLLKVAIASKQMTS